VVRRLFFEKDRWIVPVRVEARTYRSNKFFRSKREGGAHAEKLLAFGDGVGKESQNGAPQNRGYDLGAPNKT
jgi:hypothetical protein